MTTIFIPPAPEMHFFFVSVGWLENKKEDSPLSPSALLFFEELITRGKNLSPDGILRTSRERPHFTNKTLKEFEQ